MSAGIEKLPFQILKEKNFVTNVRGIHKIQMAEYVFGYILQYAKRFDLLLKSQMRKEWNRIVKPKKFINQHLPLLGCIEAKLANMESVRYENNWREPERSKSSEFDETYSVECLEEVFKKADYVVSVLPSTPDTNEMFTAAQFRTMKKEAVFINVGRGNAVNEQDLLDALNHGEIAHAFLDVFQQEPLPENHPFWECENLTITPHLSGQSERYLERAYEIFFHNLRIYLNNGHDYINKIDLDRGY